MKIIEQSAEILPERENILKQIEERGRVCYQSQDKITKDSAAKFAENIIKREHNSVLEMAVICVEFEVRKKPKFMVIEKGITSASVRAWREWLVKNDKGYASSDFKYKFPELFEATPNREPSASSPFIPMPANDWNHTYVCVRFVTNRAMTHELIRHRPCSFLQESQRYVRYDRPGGIEFIKPVRYEEYTIEQKGRFVETCDSAEENYKLDVDLSNSNRLTPQEARNNLPNSTKTELLIYCNLPQWNHIFYMRTSSAADPQMQALIKPLLTTFIEKWPDHFQYLKPSEG